MMARAVRTSDWGTPVDGAVTTAKLADDAVTEAKLALPQIMIRKTADESILNSTALQDDNHLILPVEANSTYLIQAFIIYDGSTTGDINIGWSGPAGATFDWTPAGLTTGATTVSASVKLAGNPIGTADALGAVGVGTKAVLIAEGILIVAGTAGSLTFRWAQNALDAVNATTVFTGSVLRGRKIA